MPGPPDGDAPHVGGGGRAASCGAARGIVLVIRTLKTSGIGEGPVDEMVSALSSRTEPDDRHLRARTTASTCASPPRPPTDERRASPHRARRGGSAAHPRAAPSGAPTTTRWRASSGAMLRERGLTLATMESCTGGLLASTITDVPGSSDYFRGGLVSYATEMKIGLGRRAARSSRRTASSAPSAPGRWPAPPARRWRRTSASASRASPGPTQQEGKPVGTIHIAVDDGSGEARVVSYQFAQSREMVKRRAVTAALSLLRRTLMGRHSSP